MDLIFDDAEKGDLINTDVNDTVRPEIEEIIENYKWDLGFKKCAFYFVICLFLFSKYQRIILLVEFEFFVNIIYLKFAIV